MIRQRAVGAPSAKGTVGNVTPAARMSCANTVPNWSAATLPRYATFAPSPAATAQVFAAEPPLLSVPAGIAAYSLSAVAASISAIAPLCMSWRDRNASSTGATTSTMALPMPQMSKRGETMRKLRMKARIA
jgi:hypothetical protein